MKFTPDLKRMERILKARHLQTVLLQSRKHVLWKQFVQKPEESKLQLSELKRQGFDLLGRKKMEDTH